MRLECNEFNSHIHINLGENLLSVNLIKSWSLHREKWMKLHSLHKRLYKESIDRLTIYWHFINQTVDSIHFHSNSRQMYIRFKGITQYFDDKVKCVLLLIVHSIHCNCSFFIWFTTRIALNCLLNSVNICPIDFRNVPDKGKEYTYNYNFSLVKEKKIQLLTRLCHVCVWKQFSFRMFRLYHVITIFSFVKTSLLYIISTLLW